MDPAVAELLRSLDSTDANERASAAVALGTHADTDALPALRARCADENAMVALAAMYACWRMGEQRIDTEGLLAVLASTDESTRQFGAELVTAIGNPVVEHLVPGFSRSMPEAEGALRALDDIHTRRARLAIEDGELPAPALSQLRASILDDWEEDDDED